MNVRRVLPLFLSLVLGFAMTTHAAIEFVQPGNGAQVFGPTTIEVSTDRVRVDRVDFYIDQILVGVARSSPFRITHDFGATLQSHELRATVSYDSYQQHESVALRTSALPDSANLDVDFVEIPLRLRSSRRVEAADLLVTENHVAQVIRDLHAERAPARFVFVVDHSLSMGGGRLSAALEAIDRGRAFLRSGDQIELVTFNHHVSRPVPLPPSGNLKTVLADVTASGGTSLRDAVVSTASNARTYTIVITDGTDRDSTISDEEALRRVSGTHGVIEALTFGRSGKFLNDATANTGGRAVRTALRTIDADLRHLIEDINSRYTLAYQSQGTASGWRSIAITARRGGIAIASARKGYFAR